MNMKVLKTRAIIALIIMLLATAVYMLYQIYNNSSVPSTTTQPSIHESFLGITSTTSKRIGNLVKYSTTKGELKRPLPEDKGRNVIRLQNQMRITGFKFTSTNTANPEKYRLFVAESLEQILNPSARTEITDARTSLIMNSMYNDKVDFEKEDGSPRYTGSCLAIEMADEEAGTWPTITEYQIYGLPISAPSASEYEGYANLPLQTTGGITVTARKVTLKLESDADKMVGRIDITGASTALTECQIKYRNTLDSSGQALYGVNGPIRDRFINISTDGTWYIYLEKPVLAKYLEIEFFITITTVTSEPKPTPTQQSGMSVSLFGFAPTSRDIANYKLQAGQTSNDPRLNLGGLKCPSTSEMLNKQVQAQLICEALEYKDKEKNKRLAYERDKLYLQKLKAQEDEIKALETQITGLIGRKNDLASKNQGSSIDALEKELREAETARKQAEEYLKAKDAARDGIQLKFNLDPEFKELIGST
jgi:hypothetical protein